MIKQIYTRAFNILTKMPLKLWGLSLLSGFLTILVLIFGILPIISIPVIAVINAGMAIVYLDGYNGKEVYSDQMFAGFKNFAHVAGGMCWKKLWLLLWFLIPIAGPVIAVVKSYSYAFTPYILIKEPEINATEALRKSMAETKGYKGYMFLALFLPALSYVIVSSILNALALIPFVGILFTCISIIISLVYGLFAPLFFGLVEAGFYDYAKSSAYRAKTAPVADEPRITCPQCGHENVSGSMFCGKCGSKIN